MQQDYRPLCRALGYSFQRLELLTTALTHRSAGTVHNERLEFLGDALLGYIIAETLFGQFPKASEGELTRLRAMLVKRDTLAEIARDLELGKYLKLGSGELKSGGWRRASTLADALESILGAIYLDADFNACQQTVLRLWQQRLQNLSLASLQKDPKTQLQEYLQARQRALPIYTVLNVKGTAHNQQFEVECEVPNLAKTHGQGENRRHAEQAAAAQALKQIIRHDRN